MLTMPKRGLYAITPDGKSEEEILEFAEQVLKGGAKVLQYRNKSNVGANDIRPITNEFQMIDATTATATDDEDIYVINDNGEQKRANIIRPYNLAAELLQLCHAYNVPMIINDNVELAEKIGADGVHLGIDDGDVLHARQRLGEKAIIGVSCYNSLERAIEAQNNGATYVAFGRFFSSTSKPLAAPAQIGTLTAAKKALTVPIVAIGGILPENGASLLNAGADLLAVIGGLATQNPQLATQNYCTLFSLK